MVKSATSWAFNEIVDTNSVGTHVEKEMPKVCQKHFLLALNDTIPSFGLDLSDFENCAPYGKILFLFYFLFIFILFFIYLFLFLFIFILFLFLILFYFYFLFLFLLFIFLFLFFIYFFLIRNHAFQFQIHRSG